MINRRNLLGSILGFMGIGGVALADPVSRLVNQEEEILPPKDKVNAFLNKWIQDNQSIKDLAKAIDRNLVVYDPDFPGKFSIRLMSNLSIATRRNPINSGDKDRIEYLLMEKKNVDLLRNQNNFREDCLTFCDVPVKETVLSLNELYKSMGGEHPSYFAKGVQWSFPINGGATEDIILRGNSTVWNPNKVGYSPKVEMFKVYNKNVVLAVSKCGNVLLGSF